VSPLKSAICVKARANAGCSCVGAVSARIRLASQSTSQSAFAATNCITSGRPSSKPASQ
jgi:hypothetical protein